MEKELPNNYNNNNNNNNEATTLLQYCSSIALLQERFKQLQKVKEMREKSRTSTGCFNTLSRRDDQRRPPAVWLFHAELTRASPPGLDTNSMDANRENTEEYCSELDVDTSLHL